MPEARNCESCQSAFFAARSDAKFCSTKCRKRNARGTNRLELSDNGGAVSSATFAELDSIGKTDTALGQLALELAASIDLRADPLSARASAAKELRSILEALGRHAPAAGDELDEIAQARKRRLAGA